MTHYVIVGAGAAGVAAAEAMRRRDPLGNITLLCEEPEGYYSRPGLAYYLTGELTENQLYPFTTQDFKCLNVRHLTARAMRIHPQEHKIVLQNGNPLPYDRLLIATGSMAARTKVPGIQAEGVVKLDCLDDARRISKLARRSRSAVVVGGGITALELVEGLVRKGVRVHYFLRGDRYWSNVLDEIESKIVEHRLIEEGVQIYYHTELAEVLEKRGQVYGVLTKDGRHIKCEILAVAIGVLPRIELAQASGLQIDRGIVVDEYLQTSEPDIFAAGDVAQAFDPLTGKTVLDTLWGPARDQGTVAGLNMVGSATVYRKLVPFNVTRLAQLTTTIIGTVGSGRDEDLIGIARGDSETWRQLPDAIAAQANFDVNRLRVLVGQETLLGAIVMGDQTLSHPLQHLIAHGVDITSIREQLLQPNAPIADLVVDFWTHWKSKNGTKQS